MSKLEPFLNKGMHSANLNWSGIQFDDTQVLKISNNTGAVYSIVSFNIFVGIFDTPEELVLEISPKHSINCFLLNFSNLNFVTFKLQSDLRNLKLLYKYLSQSSPIETNVPFI